MDVNGFYSYIFLMKNTALRLIYILGDTYIIQVVATFASRPVGGKDHQIIGKAIEFQGNRAVLIICCVDPVSKILWLRPGVTVPR